MQHLLYTHLCICTCFTFPFPEGVQVENAKEFIIIFIASISGTLIISTSPRTNIISTDEEYPTLKVPF